eukprot:COSAG05_NODE_4455_length_1508_cov_1.440738_1_plen_78_part_00
MVPVEAHVTGAATGHQSDDGHDLSELPFEIRSKIQAAKNIDQPGQESEAVAMYEAAARAAMVSHWLSWLSAATVLGI